MKKKKDRDATVPEVTWTIIGIFLGFSALVSAGMTALTINLNL